MKKAKKQYNKFLDGRSQQKKRNQQIITTKHRYNFLIPRLKAFITDMFLINMPLLYFVVYIIMGDKESFQHNHIVITLCEVMYCFILFLFLRFTGQTPGFRYAEIMLCSNTNNDKSKKQSSNEKSIKDSHSYKYAPTPNSLQLFIYLLVWLIELSFFLWIFSFFRKDKKTLHEIFSQTHIIYKPNPARTINKRG